MLLALIPLLVVWQDPAPPSTQAPRKPATFAEVVATHFAAWDQDHDGVLEDAEIDRLCVVPGPVGEEAAAIAALKRVVRSGKYAVPTLTREVLTAPPAPKTASAPAPKPAKPEAGTEREADDADRRDSGELEPAVAPVSEPKPSTLRKPNFASSYQSSLKRIRACKRELFLDPTPDLDACKQGPLGDCFFVAAVGAFAHRDPEALKRMVEVVPTGYRVHFGDGATVEVAPLTDAEVALSGTTGDEGLWLPVLEKAIGSLRQQQNPAKYSTATATDAISKGGTSSSTIRMLTGHTTKGLALKKQARSTEKDANGAPVPKPTVPAGPYEKLEADVRERVIPALAERRLVACSTAQEALPKGIAPRHAYAVLGYDPATDELQLWNPHGNNHAPKGEKGLKNGYPTKAGRMSIPVADFVRIFRNCTMETAEPLPRSDAKKPPAEKPAPDAPAPGGGEPVSPQPGGRDGD